MPNMVQWVISQYPSLANHPMYDSRLREFRTLKQVAEHYGLELTAEDFDAGVAERFGYGCEYEWARG